MEIERFEIKQNTTYLGGFLMNYLVSDELKSFDPLDFGGAFEPMTSLALVDELRIAQLDEFTFLDIGANIGYYSVLCANIFPKSTIYSFEPHLKVFEVLQKNADLYKNIIPFNCGIGDRRDDNAVLYCDNKNVGGHSYLKDGFGKTFNDGWFDESTGMYTINCPIKTIDSFGINFNKVKCVKIDTQGYEGKIIKDIFPKLTSGTIIVIENDQEVDEFFRENRENVYLILLYRNERIFIKR